MGKVEFGITCKLSQCFVDTTHDPLVFSDSVLHAKLHESINHHEMKHEIDINSNSSLQNIIHFNMV